MALIDGLQRYYPLDGNGNDVHGGVHGTISGPSPAFEGGSGQAQALYLGASGSNLFEATEFRPTEFAVAFQIYRRGGLNAYGGVVGNFSPGAVTSNWCFLNATSGVAVGHYANGNANTGKAANLTINTWHLVVLTRSSVGGPAGTKLYLDGVLIHTYDSGAPTSEVIDNFFIGCRPDGYTTTDARFQRVALWDRELSDAEVTELWNGGSVLSYGDLAASPAPTVASITPDSGSTLGGDPVTIIGTNFDPAGAEVEIGGAPATSVVVVDDETITAVTPAGTAGLADVVVTNLADAQSDTLEDGFEYVVPPPPEVESVTPASGPVNGGTPITISGSSFQTGATVTIGGQPCTDVVVVNDTTITAVTPSGSVGAADVVVTNPDDQTVTLSAGFTFLAVFTRYGSELAKLLPPGVLYNLEPSSVLRNLLVGLGDEFQRVEDRGADLVNESDPRTATETLEDWERMLSLPDDFVTTIPATTEQRRSAVTAKYTARGGQNREFFELLVSACGYELVSLETFHDDVLREGFRVDDRCFDEVYAYSMRLTVDPDTGALPAGDFERVVRGRTHSHITVEFVYV